MVRPLTTIALAVLLAWPAQAIGQTVDWSRAGGDLFGRETVVAGSEEMDATGLEAATLSPLNQPFAEAIRMAAERHGVDVKLLHALVIVESAYRKDACSSVGACGLAQLMPGTAEELGVKDRFDPVENLRGGAEYLARQLLRFSDVRLALAAYNAGPERVARLGRIPHIAETQAYVATVVDCYLALTAGHQIRTARECRPAGERR